MDDEPKQNGSSSARRGLYGQRPSKSADEARRREFEKIAAMTPLQRVLRALSLKERMRFIGAVSRPAKDGGKVEP
jgi:hypothetical protein